MRKITDYNNKIVISQEKSIDQKKFYKKEIKGNKYHISLVEGLNKSHFSNELYNNVTKGSKRWWVLERRKFDYINFHSKNNDKIFTNKKIEEIESQWKEKVNNFYSYIDKGYIETKTIGGNEKVPSKYLLEKRYDNEKILPIEMVEKIGLDKYNNPKYYKIIYDEDGNETDVECTIPFEKIKGNINLKKYTERWWEHQRMLFDFGMNFPVRLEGLFKDDCKGVSYQFEYESIYCQRFNCFQKRHENTWKRYIECTYSHMNDMTYEDKVKHNSSILLTMSESEIKEIMKEYPNIIIYCCPLHLYQPILIYIINKLEQTNCIYLKNNIKKGRTIEVLKKIISHFIYVEKERCEKINLDILKELIDYHIDDVYFYILYFIIYSINYGMVKYEFINKLKEITLSLRIKIPIKKENEEEKKQYENMSIGDKVTDFINQTKIMYDEYCIEEKQKETRQKDICKKNNLIYL